MNHDLITSRMARQYSELFVNRRAYTLQSVTPNPSGRYYYYRPKRETSIRLATLVKHLSGVHTIGLYAINPDTQKAKWGAIDGDYVGCVKHLVELQYEFAANGITAAFEPSRRGGHLWIFGQEPLPARLWRILILHTAKGLRVPIKGGLARDSSGHLAATRTGRLVDGIEVFPKQDGLEPGQFGNAMRGPLGIHRANGRRYWFGGADQNVSDQLEYLRQLPQLSEAALLRLTNGLSLPEDFTPLASLREQSICGKGNGFRILDHVQVRFKASKNYWGRCPSCADAGRDKSGDNLAILIKDPRFYKCWAGCTREMIREVLGHPIRERRVS